MPGRNLEGTRVDEISDGIFRISTPVASIAGGGITYNQYLLVDDEPLLFHTGKRRMFPQVREVVARVLPLERLRWISFSHFEADECGALNEFLAAAPNAFSRCCP
jgi:flavorubredoxin